MGRKILPKVDVGYSFTTVGGESATVVEKHGSMDFTVEFRTTKHRQKVHLSNIRSRKIKDQSLGLKYTFIPRAKEIFGDKYDYSKVVYKDENTRVKLYCTEHSINFTQTPKRHLMGQSGCPVCSSKARSDSALLTLSEFLNRSVAKHGCAYDYSRVDYKGNDEEVEIICYKHGPFWQKPAVHWMPCGCPKCAAENIGLAQRKPQEVWERECTELHGGKYDYSLVRYTKAINEVEIICPEHGVFKQTAIAHSTGRGCRQCGKGGFVKELPGCVYVMCTSGFTKVGVSRKPAVRAKQISNESKESVSIVYEVWMSGEDCLDVEKSVLRYIHNAGYLNPPYEFIGCKESFVGLTAHEAIQIVERFSKCKDIYG